MDRDALAEACVVSIRFSTLTASVYDPRAAERDDRVISTEPNLEVSVTFETYTIEAGIFPSEVTTSTSPTLIPFFTLKCLSIATGSLSPLAYLGTEDIY